MRGEEVLEHSLGWSTIDSISKEEARIIVTCIEQEEVVINDLMSGSSGNSEVQEGVACRVEQLEDDENGYLDCMVCGCLFSSATLLRNHLAKGHYGDETFQCRKCGNFFSTLDEVRDHVRGAQARGDQHLLCNLCGVELGGVNSLSLHMRRHRKNQSGRIRRSEPNAEEIGEPGPSSSKNSEEEMKKKTALNSKLAKQRRRKIVLAAEYQRLALLKRNFELDGELFRMSARVALWRQQAKDAELINGISEDTAVL